MFGIIFIYFIGKYFYDLAIRFDKKKWTYAILGVISYYGGSFLSLIIITIIFELSNPGYLDTMDDRVFSLFGIPFGLITCVILHKILKKKWSSKPNKSRIDILDS